MRLSRLMLVWLSLLVVANGAQGIVLCTGAHGHVAIESAGHHRCPNDAHDHGSESPDYRSGVSSESDHDHCLPCVDIPVLWGVASSDSDPVCESTSSTLPAVWGQSSWQGGIDGLVTATSFFHSIAYHSPLDSIILQV